MKKIISLRHVQLFGAPFDKPSRSQAPAWERFYRCGSSGFHPLRNGKLELPDKCVPKQELGNKKVAHGVSLPVLVILLSLALWWADQIIPHCRLSGGQAGRTLLLCSAWASSWEPGSSPPPLPLPRFLPDSITIKNKKLTLGRFELDGVSAHVRFVSTKKGLEVRLNKAGISTLNLADGDGDAPAMFRDVKFHGKMLLSEDMTRWSLTEFHMEIPPQGAVSLKGEYDSSTGALRGTVKCGGLKLGRAFARFFHLPADFHLALLLDEAFMELEREAEGPLMWKGSVHASNIEFHSADFDRAGENMTVGMGFSGRIEPDTETNHFQAHFQMERGECLYDTFYFNLSKTPFTLSLDGSYHAPSSTLCIDDLRAALHSVVQLHCRGGLDLGTDPIHGDLEITAPVQPMAPLVSKFVQEPFGASIPGIESMELDGRWGGVVRLSGPWAEPGIEGRIQILDGSLAHEPQGLHMEGISVNLPLRIMPRHMSHSIQADDMEPGHIMFRSLNTPMLHLESMVLSLQATANGYRLRENTRIVAGRGFIEIASLELYDLPSSHRTGNLVLKIFQLDLDNFMEALFTRNLAASLNTDHLELLLHGNDLESSGILYLDTFAGKVSVEELGVRQLASPFRTYRLNARWTNLDLDKLTSLTDFGRVTGHVKGHVEGLEIVQGTPIAFDLNLGSVSERKTTRKISLTAVENVTELSGGGSPFRGVGGLMTSLFKTFRYSELGIACNLKNDFFTIRGTVVEDGTEYLLKRGILGGINIINQNPNNRISWNDMLRRIERVKRESPDNTEQ